MAMRRTAAKCFSASKLVVSWLLSIVKVLCATDTIRKVFRCLRRTLVMHFQHGRSIRREVREILHRVVVLIEFESSDHAATHMRFMKGVAHHLARLRVLVVPAQNAVTEGGRGPIRVQRGGDDSWRR